MSETTKAPEKVWLHDHYGGSWWSAHASAGRLGSIGPYVLLSDDECVVSRVVLEEYEQAAHAAGIIANSQYADASERLAAHERLAKARAALTERSGT